jgi:sugar O-acyltransferase (sialic acid O-acetyltransferase NeuD family)
LTDIASQPLLILGTRTLAEEVMDVASETPGIRVAGFVENQDRARCGQPLEGLPVYWIDEVATLAKTHLGVCALATTHRWKFIEQAAELGLKFAIVTHPSAQISARASVGEGTIVNRSVVVATQTRIGRHVLLNRGAMVGHHTTIGDGCTIQPGANIAGACQIGARAFIGMGAVVLDHLKVGTGSVVGAGAVVTADVPERVMVMGVPARIVKEGIEGL